MIDVVLITYLFTSVPTAHMKAIQTVIAVILYSNSLASALYPKLLSGGTGKDIEVALSFMLMFAIPMAAGTIVMSKVFLSLLKVSYVASASALSIAAIRALFFSLASLFASCLIGIEKIELFENVTFNEFLRCLSLYRDGYFLASSHPYVTRVSFVVTFVTAKPIVLCKSC